MPEERTHNLANRETFYTGFYGLQSSPFHVVPDPDNLFLTEAHKHAIGAIYYGIVGRKGFVVVTGEVGVGKTSVLRAALSRLDRETTQIIYLYNPRLSSEALYQSMLTSLGDSMESRKFPLHILHYRLLKLYQRGVNVALVIDEAQNMPEGTLEDLRVLSNLETRANKLLQIVLVAQPELDAVLEKRSLRQLKQRIAVRATIPGLSLKQSFRYVRYRLAAAGNREPDRVFSLTALTYLILKSGGNPRKLNIYCDNALINGLGHRSKRITLEIAREALRQFGEGQRYHSFLRWVAVLGCIVMLGVLNNTSYRPVISSWLDEWIGTSAVNGAATPSVTESSNVEPAVARAGALQLDAPRTETAVADASNEDDIVDRARAPGTIPVLSPVASSINSAGDGAAVEPKNMLKPPMTNGSVHPDAAPGQPESNIRVTVRRGDALIQLCRRIYGKCDNAKLQYVLDKNPGIRSANALVSGETVVFPKLAPSAGVTEIE